MSDKKKEFEIKTEGLPKMTFQDERKLSAQAEAAAEPAEPAEKDDAGDSSGGIFSKLLKNRQARMDAVGDDDEYDIFDLQELMGFTDDDFEEDDHKADEGPDREAADDGRKRGSRREKKPSLFSKLKKEKGAKPDENIVKIEAEEAETPEIEKAQTKSNEPATHEEPEPFVNPLDEMESFDKETQSALDSINEMMDSAGMGKIAGSALDIEDMSAEGIEREIEARFEELEAEKTKVASSDEKRKAGVESGGADFEDIPSNRDTSPDQIQLEDYDAESIEPQIVNELDEEEKLKKKRKGFVEKFRVNAKIFGEDAKYVEEKTEGTADVVEDVEIKDGEGVFDAVERTAGEKTGFIDALKKRIEKQAKEENLLTINEVVTRLEKDKKKNLFHLIAEGAVGVALLVFAIIGSTYTEGESVGFLFNHGGRMFVLINLVLYAIAIVIAKDSFKKAIDRVRSGVIDSRAVWLCLNAVIVLQMLIALCAGLNASSGFVVYSLVGSVSVIGELLSAKVNIESLSQSLAVLRKNELNSIQPIQKKEESAVLGYDLAEGGDPSIYYSSPIKLPENIAYLSENTSKEQKASKFSILIPAVAGLILAVIVCIIRRSAMPLVTVWPCMMCISLPIFRPLVLSLFKAEANKGSIRDGVSVLSYDDCDDVSRANAVVIDTSELIGVNASEFKKYKGAKMAKTDAAIYTAAVLRKSGSMLSKCFESFVEQSGIEIPEASDFETEQGLGFTAWVDGAKVIVGTRKCIECRQIPCPTEEQEKAYSGGAHIIYTCVEDRIVSTFKATYLPRRNAKKQIDAIRKSGIVVMLDCSEPSLTEEIVCDILHCSAAMIKIISSNGHDIIKANKESLSDPENNGVFATKKKHNIILAVADAYNLSQRRRMSKNVSMVFLALLAAVYFICGIFRFTTAFSPITIIIFSAAAAAISFGIGKLSDR